MKKVVLLSSDQKASLQMYRWLKELRDEVAVETFASVQAFTEACLVDAPAKTKKTDKKMDENGGIVIGEDLKKHLPIHLVVVDLDGLGIDAKKWITETKKILAERKLSLPEAPTRFMVIAFESHDFDPARFQHDAIDDLVLKPLDHSLYLQKIELLLANRRAFTPSFLFKQKTDFTIEVGKDATIEEVWDHALAIRNPTALAAGVYAKLYTPLFGKKDQSGILGRVYKSVRHPTQPGQFLCYFAFFGLGHAQLQSVRKYIRDTTSQAKTIEAPIRKPESAMLDAVLSDGYEVPPELRKKNVVIIDINEQNIEAMRQCLRSNFADVDVYAFPTYKSFLKQCQKRIVSSSRRPSPVPTAKREASDADSIDLGTVVGKRVGHPFPFAQELSFLIDPTTFAISNFEPTPKSEDTIFDVPAAEILKQPRRWFELLDSDQKAELQELLSYAGAGQVGTIQLAVRTAKNEVFDISVRGSLPKGEDATQGIRLQLKPAVPESAKEKDPFRGERELAYIDAVFIDASFVADFNVWSKGFREVLGKAGIRFQRNRLPVVLMAEEGSKNRPESYRLPEVFGFLSKPLDRKLLLETLSTIMPVLEPTENFVPSTGLRATLDVKVAKEVYMEEFSEYGLQIRHRTPLREDIFMRFFSPLLQDERGEGVIGRCVSSTKDTAGTDTYHCFFTFFGVSDALLKHIRTWIREDYIARKERKSG